LVRTLYLKYMHSQTKFRVNPAGTYFEDWTAVFPGMVDAEDRVPSEIFL